LTAWLAVALRWSFCAFIAWASADSFLAASSSHGASHLGEHGQLILSAAEFVAALALLVPALGRFAAVALCLVFAFAAIVTVSAGEAPLRFVYYAATAVLLGFSDRRIDARAA
jgi:hypothetical protein